MTPAPYALLLSEQEARAVLGAGGYGCSLQDHDAYLRVMVRLRELVDGAPAPVRQSPST